MQVEVLHDRSVSPSEELTCAYPLTTLGADGSIVCLYRRGQEKHSYDGVLVSQRSTDLGRTWSDPVTVFAGQHLNPPQAAVSGGLCKCGDGSLLAVIGIVEVTRPDVYIFSEEGFTQRRLLAMVKSTDGGRSWNPCKYVDIAAPGKPFGASKPLLLDDCRIFFPGEHRHEGGQLGMCASFSSDHGESLEPVHDCIVDPTAQLSLCDARFALFDDGQMLALLWTFRQSDEQTVEVHRSVSDDQGRTWSEARPVGHLGQITAPLVVAGDSVIAASNYRWPPQGIRLWQSRDRGETWPVGESLQMWDADQKQMLAQPLQVGEQSQNDSVWDALPGFTFGTPDLTALPDGTVLLTYYAEIDGLAQVRACRFTERDRQ